MLSFCGFGKDSGESLGLRGDQMTNLFIGRTDIEAEGPTLWPLDENNGLTGRDSDAGQD